MNEVAIKGLSIDAISVAVPRNEVTTEDLTWLSKEERNNIQAAVGIERRRVAHKVCLRQLCLSATTELLQYMEIDAEEIGLLLLVTQTSAMRIPSLAFELHHSLGLGPHCVSMEVNWGCAGYVYGLWLAAHLLAQNPTKSSALLVAGDVSTHCLSKQDSSTVPLFSDAVSATLLSRNENRPTTYFSLQSDTSKRDLITLEEASGHRRPKLHMDGMGIFQFAIEQVRPHLEHILEQEMWHRSEIDYLVCHQASRIVCEAIRSRLNLSAAQCPYSLREWGNTSSASIPITLLHTLSSELQNHSKRLILCGFGTGLCWGTMRWESRPMHFVPIIEC